MRKVANDVVDMQGAWKILLPLAACLLFLGWLAVDLALGALQATGWSAVQAWLSAVVIAGLSVLFLWLLFGFGRPWVRYLRQRRQGTPPDDR
ncbi:hypothetical protein [Enteractinococcus coprophilus]|uniref:Uncharacterized protein n=1 Tax=Enteractinococcus coprophilus TaxID=1027633 RepID=A0A543AP69_9MICC|nr:hypothetical protein [Enteractinococcus coprophilus]TQL74380.1 hypothetical protein FB556_0844 [Enteractinococcus coprophilus]